MSEGDSISLEVVRRVAEREGIDPVELRPPLHAVVDTEALDTLFSSAAPGGNGTVEFSYRGYRVRVESSGDVRVTEPASATETGARSSVDSVGE